MIERPWEDHGEETLVRAIHQAMSQCFGRIWEESGDDSTTFQNRCDRQMERWRLALATPRPRTTSAVGFRTSGARLDRCRP